jgi:hypothetical protein
MSEPTQRPEPFDPDQWEGDFDELESVQEELLDSEELCDLTFYSKREAFAAGHHLGKTDGERDAES